MIRDVKGYSDTIVLLLMTSSIVYYDIKSRKQLRRIEFSEICDHNLMTIQLLKSQGREIILTQEPDGAGLLADLDYEEIIGRYNKSFTEKVVGVEWLKNSKTFIQLLDCPVPTLLSYSILNYQWKKVMSRPIPSLQEVLSMKIDDTSSYVFVGTKHGLLQGFSTKDLSPVTDIMTVSTFAIHNIELLTSESGLYMALSLSSGQVLLFRTENQRFKVSQNSWKHEYTIQRQVQPAFQLSFEFVSQIHDHFAASVPNIY